MKYLHRCQKPECKEVILSISVTFGENWGVCSRCNEVYVETGKYQNNTKLLRASIAEVRCVP